VDAQSRNAILETIQLLNRKGATVLYTTHLMEEAERCCHRVAILDQGKILALEKPQVLVKRAGGGMIRIVFDSAVPPSFQEYLASPGSLHPSLNQVVIINLDAGNKLAVLKRILDQAQREQLTIRNLEILDSNLETVFLRLTGKHLRD
jgi:ABC-2 type transport system ATP-binding protein